MYVRFYTRLYFEAAVATLASRSPSHPARICCTRPESDPRRSDPSAIFYPATASPSWLYAIMKINRPIV